MKTILILMLLSPAGHVIDIETETFGSESRCESAAAMTSVALEMHEDQFEIKCVRTK